VVVPEIEEEKGKQFIFQGLDLSPSKKEKVIAQALKDQFREKPARRPERVVFFVPLKTTDFPIPGRRVGEAFHAAILRGTVNKFISRKS